MPESTNLLRAKAQRFAAPGVALALALSAGAFVAAHKHVNAATSPDTPNTPINNASIDPLLALDQATEAVASRVTPAVVNIAVTARASEEPADMQGQGPDDQDGQNPFSQFFGPQGPMRGQQPQQRQQIEHGIGSGVIISPNGYIVTNNHVVNGAMEVRVTLHDRRTFPARVIGTDKLTDLAVVKIDATDLPTIGWGDSTKLVPGQSVWLLPLYRHSRHRERCGPAESLLQRSSQTGWIYPNRCGDQPRQLRWSAGERARRAGWHQHLPHL